jgi:toxin-antitoxin system PIN domain toxin
VILPDVNVLVYAGREDAPDHRGFRKWLEGRIKSREAFGLSELVLSGVVRVLSHPRVFIPLTPLGAALEFVEALRSQPNAVVLRPGSRHWEIFASLCRSVDARGNLAADAYHAALAIEHGCEWITTDRAYARFPGLRWRHPLK